MKILILYNTIEYVWLRRTFIADLQARGHEVIAAGPFDGWEGRVESLGVPCHHIPMSRWGINPWQELRTFYQICRLLREQRPEATICYTIKPVFYGPLASWLLRQRRPFSVVTGLGFMFVASGPMAKVRWYFAKLLYKTALKRTQKVFFQNADDLAVFLRSGIVGKEQAVRVAGSGVDTTYFAPPEEPAEEARFILVSRMLWDKGIQQYVQAAANLKAKYPFAIFDLVGAPDDNPASIPLQQLQQWDQEGSINYHGYIEDIRPWLGRALVYILPSYYREGIPRTNLEALAMGKAIITTDMPGCRETVEQSINGFLIAPRNVAQLEEAMESFIKDPDLARRMGVASRKLAVERFQMNVVNRTIAETLERESDPLLASPHAPGSAS